MTKCLKNICQGEFHFLSWHSRSVWNYVLWKQLENQTKYRKQLFSHLGQQAMQSWISTEREDKWGSTCWALILQAVPRRWPRRGNGKHWNEDPEIKIKAAETVPERKKLQKGRIPGMYILSLLSVWVDTSLSLCRVKFHKARKEQFLRNDCKLSSCKNSKSSQPGNLVFPPARPHWIHNTFIETTEDHNFVEGLD